MFGGYQKFSLLHITPPPSLTFNADLGKATPPSHLSRCLELVLNLHQKSLALRQLLMNGNPYPQNHQQCD